VLGDVISFGIGLALPKRVLGQSDWIQ
jgi:hypothetical protein